MAANEAAPGQPAVRKFSTDGSVYVQLAGKVDEAWSSAGIPEDVDGAMVLDMKGIEQFTSGGIRKWVKFISEVRCRYLGIVHCRPATVAQFNSVVRFGGRGELISFFAP